jgi:membrane protein YdbS with pleckstrin-like domain
VSLPVDPAAAARFVWWASLALGSIVALVVTLLLWRIHRAARSIHDRVGAIWMVGQRIANNTVHIPALYRTNETVARILEQALRIERSAVAIERHARACPGCPQCLAHGD